MIASHRRLGLGLVLSAVLASAACGTGSDEPGGMAEPEASDSATGTETAAESTPAEAEEPSAADGTDYAACEDGSCEVVVSGDPVEFPFADFTLTVTITADGIETYTANDDSTRTGSSSMSGPGMSEAYCVAYLSAESNTMNCYPDTEPGDVPPPEAESGVLVLEMLDFAEGTAVIRLAMG